MICASEEANLSTERAFDKAMLRIYERAKDEVGYKATRFLQMISEHGGLEAARQLLHSSAVSDGFTTLWEKGRLDLSVEAHVLQPEFSELFSQEEREIAERRLTAYGFEVARQDEKGGEGAGQNR